MKLLLRTCCDPSSRVRQIYDEVLSEEKEEKEEKGDKGEEVKNTEVKNDEIKPLSKKRRGRKR